MAVAVPDNGNSAGYYDSVRSYFPCGTRALRACIQCRVIMEKNQFFELGCPQCPELKMQENDGRVAACTTQKFEGIIANIRPGGFATRFTGLEKRMPGFYALVVRGEIPSHVLNDEMDEDLPGLVNDRDGSESPTSVQEDESELFPKTKKRRTQEGKAQPPSRDSSTSIHDAPELDARTAKALDFIDSDSDTHETTEADASGRPKDQVIPSASELTHSATERPSASEGRTHSGSEQLVHSGSGTDVSKETGTSKRDKKSSKGKHDGSESESQQSKKSGQSRDSRHSAGSRHSKTSQQTATSDRSRSVAILEPEGDDEFREAPK